MLGLFQGWDGGRGRGGWGWRAFIKANPFPDSPAGLTIRLELIKLLGESCLDGRGWWLISVERPF